ncbi:hypothetical protein K2P97_07190 [bacterium]|nr:hypothetical protein [bacterium]
MQINFQNIYVIDETITRKSLNDFFWPQETFNFTRQALTDQNKREGWYCEFTNNGLSLVLKILISSEDYTHWPKAQRPQNPNIVSSEVRLFPEFQIKTSEPALRLRSPASMAEILRKKIYLSSRFGESADKMWAAQYFNSPTKDFMIYEMGFNREMQASDIEILASIKSEISELQGIEFF